MAKASTAKTTSAKAASPRKPAVKATAAAARKRAPVRKAAATAGKASGVATRSVKPIAAPKSEQKPEVKEKAKKIKLVRDSFTMPEAEYAVLGEVKKACLKAGIEVKKSELLRVGVAMIRQLDLVKLKEVLNALPTLKAGRPKKNK